jgi:hypothetical protein
VARRRLFVLGLGGMLALAAALTVFPSAVMATQPTGHKVDICHATDSDTNPYVAENVDIASAGYPDGATGHAGHTGPVWSAGLKADKIKWGDIIPPYTYDDFSFPGLNWSTEGQAIWNAGCQIPGESAPASQPEETPFSSEQGETATPFSSEQGETGSPVAPPTGTSDGPMGGGTPLYALLISGLFGALGLTAAQYQRRVVRR